MATVQSLDYTNTIVEAKAWLLRTSEIIFSTINLSEVEALIAEASKVRFGLIALETLNKDDAAYQQIIVGLNKICNIY